MREGIVGFEKLDLVRKELTERNDQAAREALRSMDRVPGQFTYEDSIPGPFTEVVEKGKGEWIRTTDLAFPVKA